MRAGIGIVMIGCLAALTVAVARDEAIATGPEVGARIPAFQAPDQRGTLRSFEDLRGPEGLLLLFHRTADW